MGKKLGCVLLLLFASSLGAREIDLDDVNRLRALPQELESVLKYQPRLRAALVSETTKWVGEVSDRAKPRMRLLLCTQMESDAYRIVSAYTLAMNLPPAERINLTKVLDAADSSNQAFTALAKAVVGQLKLNPKSVFLFEGIETAPKAFQNSLAHLFETAQLQFSSNKKGEEDKRSSVALSEATFFASTTATMRLLETAAWGGGLGFKPDPERGEYLLSDPGLRDELKESDITDSLMIQIARVAPVMPASTPEQFQSELRAFVKRRFPSYGGLTIETRPFEKEIWRLSDRYFAKPNGLVQALNDIENFVDETMAVDRITKTVACANSLADFAIEPNGVTHRATFSPR